MDKFEFITELRAKLWALPEADKQRSVDYYREMIDDRMEDGLSEEERELVLWKNAKDLLKL